MQPDSMLQYLRGVCSWPCLGLQHDFRLPKLARRLAVLGCRIAQTAQSGHDWGFPEFYSCWVPRMQRQFIAELQPRDSVDEVYRVAEKQIRANRQGNDYILVQLTDRSGQISGLRWNAGQSVYETFQKGDFLRVLGTAQLHNGALQIIVQDFEPVPRDKVQLADFEKTSSVQMDLMVQELNQRLRGLRDPHLAALAESYLGDPTILNRLRKAPAGIKTHHAYEGGLLQHVLHLMRVAEALLPLYPQVDGELLVMGVFLHDLGKLDELHYDGEMSYSDPGQLLGHLVQGVIDLDRRICEVSKQSSMAFPESLRWRLEHMVISHHGQLEHGSPKVPMTLEAILLAYIDDLDAKINQASELIESDRNSDSPWTGFHPTLGRKLYKPSLGR